MLKHEILYTPLRADKDSPDIEDRPRGLTAELADLQNQLSSLGQHLEKHGTRISGILVSTNMASSEPSRPPNGNSEVVMFVYNLNQQLGECIRHLVDMTVRVEL